MLDTALSSRMRSNSSSIHSRTHYLILSRNGSSSHCSCIVIALRRFREEHFVASSVLLSLKSYLEIVYLLHHIWVTGIGATGPRRTRLGSGTWWLRRSVGRTPRLRCWEAVGGCCYCCCKCCCSHRRFSACGWAGCWWRWTCRRAAWRC